MTRTDVTFALSATANAQERRAPLLSAMARLNSEGNTCVGCVGTCCTFVANSMQITPLEALDLYAFLETRGRLGPALDEALRANITNFALDRAPASDGRRVFARRRYTCPFYAGKALGCTVTPASKPYGCLAFNALRPGVADGEACASDQAALTAREAEAASEAEANAAAASACGFTWEKLPIPVALQAVIQALAAKAALL